MNLLLYCLKPQQNRAAFGDLLFTKLSQKVAWQSFIVPADSIHSNRHFTVQTNIIFNVSQNAYGTFIHTTIIPLCSGQEQIYKDFNMKVGPAKRDTKRWHKAWNFILLSCFEKKNLIYKACKPIIICCLCYHENAKFTEITAHKLSGEEELGWLLNANLTYSYT